MKATDHSRVHAYGFRWLNALRRRLLTNWLRNSGLEVPAGAWPSVYNGAWILSDCAIENIRASRVVWSLNPKFEALVSGLGGVWE